MNLYTTLADFKAAIGVTSTANDATSLLYLETASREVEAPDMANRFFYTETATNYYDGFLTRSGRNLMVDDFVSLSAVTADTERDGTYDGETWTEDTDFYTWPYNQYPKTQLMRTDFGSYCFGQLSRYYKLSGEFGYGDGTSDPWEVQTVTVTVADATTTTITVSADDVLKVGHTIKAGLEQMYITAVGTGSFTAVRGVNGTTATAHSTAASSIAQYPAEVSRAVIAMATALRNSESHSGFEGETIGDYRYKLSANGGVMKTAQKQALVSRLRKEAMPSLTLGC